MSGAMNKHPESGRQFIAPILAHLHKSLTHDLTHPRFPDPSYVRGAAGQLLALAALATHPVAPAPDLALLEEGVHRLLLSVPQMPHSLFHGAEGAVFAALEIDRHFGFNFVDDFAAEFDECLYSHLCDNQELPEHFDLISVKSGLLVYACYRAQQTGDARLVPLCVNRLANMVTHDERGAFWFTPAEWIRGTPIGNAHPLGCIDLGLAHGQPGPLGALALAILVGRDTRASTHELLRAAIQFLRGQELAHGHARFSWSAGSNNGTLCAWCYGDLGLVGALRLAAQACVDPAIDAWGDKILHGLKHWTTTQLGFDNPYICHGACGAAWLLRQLDADAELSELTNAFQTTGVAQYQNHQLGDRIGLLEGLAGIALVLAEQDGWRSPLNWALPLLPGRRSLSFEA